MLWFRLMPTLTLALCCGLFLEMRLRVWSKMVAQDLENLKIDLPVSP
jgi:hypothetical protein